jgi:hypothetical protein
MDWTILIFITILISWLVWEAWRVVQKDEWWDAMEIGFTANDFKDFGEMFGEEE